MMPKSGFHNVALLGSTGNLGSKILKSLIGVGFKVTAIQRLESTKQVRKDITSIQVDLTSKADLLSAFKGQDAVIRQVWISYSHQKLTNPTIQRRPKSRPQNRENHD
jgi:putative NADH-flavin reductase